MVSIKEYMKICIAQTRPVKGNIQGNIAEHKRFIGLAASQGAGFIVFPELSLTGYEPALAEALATSPDDNRLDELQTISNNRNIIIGAGLPTRADAGIRITMIIFQPHKPRATYSKQYLHSDEDPYFVEGDQPLLITIGKDNIAPAICYESLLPEHAEDAFKSGAGIYIASVAKSAKGVSKAFKHFPEIAQKYSMSVLMSNSVGPSDDFVSAGNTAVWNNKGVLVSQLNDTDEGLLIFDTDTQEATQKVLFSHQEEKQV